MSSPFDPQTAASDGHFILAAYAMYAVNNDDLTPNYAQFMPDGWDLVAWIEMSDFILGQRAPRFYGFIARNRADTDAHVIALRGTEGWLEWYDDFSIFKVPFAQVKDCGLVAHGFDEIYQTLHVRRPPKVGEAPDAVGSNQSVRVGGSFADQVESVASDRPPRPATPGAPSAPSFAVTGHSLGAALCTLYAMEHARRQKPGSLRLSTFASPRVGDANFASIFNGLGLTSWRVVNAQ